MSSPPAASPRFESALPSGASPAAACPASPRARKLAKRIGIIGVALFLLKGILWLVIPILLVGKGCVS